MKYNSGGLIQGVGVGGRAYLAPRNTDDDGWDFASEFGFNGSAGNQRWYFEKAVQIQSGGLFVNSISAYTTDANLVLSGNGTGFVQVNDPLQVVGNTTINENLFMTGGKFFYLAGDADTDGSIRLSASGTNIITERRISGTWTTGTTIPA